MNNYKGIINPVPALLYQVSPFYKHDVPFQFVA